MLNFKKIILCCLVMGNFLGTSLGAERENTDIAVSTTDTILEMATLNVDQSQTTVTHYGSIPVTQPVHKVENPCLKSIGGLLCCTTGTACLVGLILLESLPVILSSRSDVSGNWALSSAICNSIILFCSACLKKDNKDHAIGTAIFYLAATITAWIYWSDWHKDEPLNNGLRIANIVCTSIVLASNFLKAC